MPGETKRIANYLLGQAAEEDCREIEKRLLADDDFYEFFLTVENDLHERYLAGEFSAAEKEAFETHFLAHPERKRDLWLTQALREKAAAEKSPEAARVVSEPSPEKFDLRRLFRILAPAFGVLLLIAGGFYWWNTSRNAFLNDGLAALKDAYKTERPLGSRLSDFDYAPFQQTRGAGEKQSDNLRLAELNLIQAVKKNPGAVSHNALGLFYLASRDFTKAIDNFNEALRLEPGNPKINNNLGVAWLEAGKVEAAADQGKAAVNFGESLKYFNQAIALNKNLPEAFFNRAETYQNLFLPEKAIEDLQNYLRIDPDSRWAGEARERLRILEEQKVKAALTRDQIIEKFKSAYRNKDTDQAWQMIKLARSRTGNFITDRLIDDFLEQVRPGDGTVENDHLLMLKFAGEITNQIVGDIFLSDLAQFYAQIKPSSLETAKQGRQKIREGQELFQASRLELAIEKFRQAENLFNSIQDSPEELFARIWTGFCSLRIPRNQMRDEMEIFTRLAEQFEKKRYFSLQAQSLLAISDAQISINEQSRSQESASKGLALAQKNQDTESLIRYYQAKTAFHKNIGKYKNSIADSFSAFGTTRDFATKPNVLWTFYFISAESFHSLGYLDAAFAYQEKAIRLAEENGNPLLTSRSFEQSALFYRLNNDLTKALENGKKAISFGEEINDGPIRLDIVSKVSLLLGEIYRQAGNYQAALDHYRRAEEIYGKLNFKAKLYQIFRGKALTYIALKEYGPAREELDRSIEQYELFRQNIFEESNRTSFFDIEQGIYDVAIDFAFTHLNDEVRALNYSEISRARGLLDLLHTDTLLIQEKESRDISLKSMTVPKELSQLQSRIPDNSQLLEFAVLEDKIISWVITKNSCRATKLAASAAELRAKIKDYLEILNSTSDPRNDELTRTAKELFRILLAPNKPFLDTSKTLFIIPDKALHLLPFSSLIDPETDKYLVEDHTVGISPSLNVFILNLAKAKEKANDDSEHLLAVGNPFFEKSKHPDLDYLPAALREAVESARFYTTNKTLLDNEATKSKVREAMKDAEIIHFASHAVTDENDPMLSGLVLAGSEADGDGTLRAFELYRNNLPKTKLVILSACQTGVEQAFRGEGAISLARPFIAMGVPMVVASLWKVESESTAELMIKFHRFRKSDKLNSTESLRRSQLEMLRSQNPTFQHPRSWASFIAIGSEVTF